MTTDTAAVERLADEIERLIQLRSCLDPGAEETLVRVILDNKLTLLTALRASPKDVGEGEVASHVRYIRAHAADQPVESARRESLNDTANCLEALAARCARLETLLAVKNEGPWPQRQMKEQLDAANAEMSALRGAMEDASYIADLLEWAYERVALAGTEGEAMTMANIERIIEKLRTLPNPPTDHGGMKKE